MSGPGRGGHRQGEDGEFAPRMRELRDGGGAMLVVGEGSSAVHADACRRLLGDDAATPRRRVLVFPDGAFAVDARLPPGAVGSDARVVTASSTRSAAATADGTDAAGFVELGDASLADVGVALAAAVEEVERLHGPLEPTELRVCVESLPSLLEAHDGCVVVGFLLVATRLVRRFDGLGHFHLPVDRDAYAARLLAPLFDAVVEVRVEDGRPQQRWHFDDGDVTSRWLPL